MSALIIQRILCGSQITVETSFKKTLIPRLLAPKRYCAFARAFHLCLFGTRLLHFSRKERLRLRLD